MKKDKILEYIHKRKYYLSLLGVLCVIAVALFITTNRQEGYGEIADLNEPPIQAGIVENTISDSLVDNEPMNGMEATIPDILIEGDGNLAEALVTNNEDNEQTGESLDIDWDNAIEITEVDGEAVAEGEDDGAIETFSQNEENADEHEGVSDDISVDEAVSNESAGNSEATEEVIIVTEEELPELQPIITIEQPNVLFELSQGISAPLVGEVIIPFNDETPVYFETLDQYRVSHGIYIEAEVGQEVKAVADGIVEKIEYVDDRGYVVIIYHGNEYKSEYGQLQEALNVQEGDVVSEGKVIGYIEEVTSYYRLEGNHLYFEFLEDGEAINPIEIMK